MISMAEQKTFTITVAGEPREVTPEYWSVDKLRLDPTNPRFGHVEDTFTEKKMEELIWNEDETKDLYREILASKGLQESLIIKPDGLVVEGNRRTVCLKKIKEQITQHKIDAPETIYTKISCFVLPKNMPERELKIYLGRLHVTGKLQWNAFDKARYVYELNKKFNFSFGDMKDLLSINKATLYKFFWSYSMTQNFLKRNPKRAKVNDYSFFEEAYKKKVVRDWLNDEANIKKFESWILEGNLKRALDLRELPKIWESKDAKEVFEKDGIDAAKKVLYGGFSGRTQLTQLTEKLVDTLRTLPREEYNELPGNKAKIDLLKRVKEEIDKLFKELSIK